MPLESRPGLGKENPDQSIREIAATDPGLGARLAPAAPPAAAPRAFKLAQTVIIDRPSQVVFAFRSALGNSPQWRRGVVSASVDPPGPIWVGSHCTEIRSASEEATEAWDLEVTGYEPTGVLEIFGRAGDAEVRERHLFGAEGDSTRYTVTVEVSGGTVSGPAFQRQLLEGLLQLKWTLEGTAINLKSLSAFKRPRLSY